MPICKSSPAMASSKKGATDISADHVTEAAQVKRTREQAYFNSYDFDAIEVLPYDEDNDDDDEEEDAAVHRPTSGPYSATSKTNSSAHIHNKFAYLQRLSTFFGQKSSADGANVGTTTTSTTATGEQQPGAALPATAAPGNENFLLPRAILKYPYQSAAGNATMATVSASTTTTTATTSMPMIHMNGATGRESRETGPSLTRPNDIKPSVAAAAAVAVAATTTRNKKRSTASNASSTVTTDSGLGNSNTRGATTGTGRAATASATAATTAVAATARGGSGSHYSTDKSGSSGYYSSHVCSTYSLDEHIYCEPAIDILDAGEKEKTKVLAKQRPQLQLPSNEAATKITAISQHLDMQDASSGLADSQVEAGAELGSGQEAPLYSDKLRILETSIENLDRHLKSFPCLYGPQSSKVIVNTAAAAAAIPLDIGEKLRAYNQLPTIMEGYTMHRRQQQQQQQPLEQLDDSLLDIDLDAFLLQPKPQQQKQQQNKKQRLAGVDNACFLSDEQLEENNYKCAKYINSCPEDAYRLDVTSNSSYAKRYEDQLHFQSTRELLEDVRDKIRLLAPTPTTNIPHELEGMIETLKDELESYLQRMNQHSELELRQLSSGLGRQQHVVRLQNALERRRSYAGGESQLSNAYESMRDGVLISAAGGQTLMTIRCASDPNFKMKRKSIAEIFPAAECFIESRNTPTPTPTPTPTTTPSLTPSPPLELKTTTTMITQMQRNLTFHRPVLNTAHTRSSSRLSNGQDKVDSAAEWHRKKPSIWQMYYGTNRLHQSLLGKQRPGGELVISNAHPTLSYPSSRPESDFTLDLPRAEQLRLKMEKEKKFRQRCRLITTFLSLVFFLLTVMVVSLVLTRGKRMFGSMI